VRARIVRACMWSDVYPVEVAVTVKRPARHANFPQSSRRPVSHKKITLCVHLLINNMDAIINNMNRICKRSLSFVASMRDCYRKVCRVTRNVVASTSATLNVSSTGNLALSWYSNPESRGNSEARAS
jgi:hypothetical protein